MNPWQYWAYVTVLNNPVLRCKLAHRCNEYLSIVAATHFVLQYNIALAVNVAAFPVVHVFLAVPVPACQQYISTNGQQMIWITISILHKSVYKGYVILEKGTLFV